MLHIILIFIIVIHGSLHFIGLVKALGFGSVLQLQVPVSRTAGLLWTITGILFFVTAVQLIQHRPNWYWTALFAVLLSQAGIISNWSDTKAGTFANIIIFIAALLSYCTHRFENTYSRDVQQNLNNCSISNDMITEQDLVHLPLPVQRYLKYAGVINRPRLKNMRIVFEGQMREKGKNWFTFTSEQYNFFDDPARLFFMKAKMFGLTVPGYHRYVNASASMNVRLFGMFPVASYSGPVMDTTETVTLFNDMCLMAPASLIDRRIQWQPVNDTAATAKFTNHGISITAILYFNKTGQLVNFVSNDRTSVKEMKIFPFSTPVMSYSNINGYNLMSQGEAVWHYPDGAFTYGKFHLKLIEYNIAPAAEK